MRAKWTSAIARLLYPLIGPALVAAVMTRLRPQLVKALAEAMEYDMDDDVDRSDIEALTDNVLAALGRPAPAGSRP